MNSLGITVFSDFDGTISEQDVNLTLFDKFGTEKNRQVEEDFKNNKISGREAMKRHYTGFPLSREELEEFLRENISIDPYFPVFFEKMKTQGIPVIVVSAGFYNYIDFLLKQEGITEEVKIIANRFIFTDDGIKPLLLDEKNPSCNQEHGPCSVCKLKTLKENGGPDLKVFIGDGIVDPCPSRNADIVFARGKLARVLTREGIDFYPFANFKEVENRMQEIFCG